MASMPSLRIILICIAAAVVYGVSHDQVTARVCVEYFTVGHAPIFHTESPTLLAIGWGTLATWWVGLILGILATAACRAGSWPKLNVSHLIRPIACLLIVMAVSSLLAGITGYRLAEASGLVLPKPLGLRVPVDHHHPFFADSLAHLAAYAVGLVGGVVLCVRVVVQRYRMARPDAAKARVNTPAEPGIVVLSRWTARTIGIPVFGLIVILIHGDGVPNPLRASMQQNLLSMVVLVMLLGVVLAWRWEGAGSLLILGGLFLYAMVGERLLLDIVLTPWVAMGLLCLVCWVYRQMGRVRHVSKTGD
jgi:hypothetical protein